MERAMIIDSLEEMCDLMCGGIEEDYELEEENNDLTNKEHREGNKVNGSKKMGANETSKRCSGKNI